MPRVRSPARIAAGLPVIRQIAHLTALLVAGPAATSLAAAKEPAFAFAGLPPRSTSSPRRRRVARIACGGGAPRSSGSSASPSPADRSRSSPKPCSSPRASSGLGSPAGLRRVDMCPTCSYRLHMPKMIQLRHVPDALHRTLKARAALAGLPLSDYLLQEIRRVAERPTPAEMRERLAQRKPVATGVAPAKAVRAERERR